MIIGGGVGARSVCRTAVDIVRTTGVQRSSSAQSLIPYGDRSLPRFDFLTRAYCLIQSRIPGTNIVNPLQGDRRVSLCWVLTSRQRVLPGKLIKAASRWPPRYESRVQHHRRLSGRNSIAKIIVTCLALPASKMTVKPSLFENRPLRISPIGATRKRFRSNCRVPMECFVSLLPAYCERDHGQSRSQLGSLLNSEAELPQDCRPSASK